MPKQIIKTVFLTLIFSLLLANCLPKKQNAGGVTNDADESDNLTETTEESLYESDPRLSTFKMVSAGHFHVIAIKTDGTLWAWGENRWGQLGDGTTDDRISPVRIGKGNDWAFVSVGAYHSVALKTDGSLWAWGEGDWGEVGDGAKTERHSPVRIGTDNDWASISAGREFTMAIKTDGTMWAWGSNHYDQLGINGKIADIPIRIGSDNDWAFVSAGDRSSLAIKTNGSIWILGEVNGGNGREAINRGVAIGEYEQVKGTGNDWVSAAVGHDSYIAIKKDGTLWAWGYGFYYHNPPPKQIGTDTDWLSVSTTYSNMHSDPNIMAIKKDGSLWAWGTLGYEVENGPGGDIEKMPILEYGKDPVRLWGDTTWSYIFAGTWSAFAIMKDGSLWAWGANTKGWGYLGDGTEEDRYIPVQIGGAK